MIHVATTPRRQATAATETAVLLGSLLAGFAAVSIVFVLNGVNPFYAIYRIFRGSFGSLYSLKETATKAIPLVIIGGGLTLAFTCKFWNIGAEGQLLMGATLSTWVALNIGPHAPAAITIPLMLAAGFIGGAALGLIPAVLKVRFGTNEVISTLMLNYVAAELVQLLITGPWKGTTQYGFPYTDDFPPSAVFPLFAGSRIHIPTLVVAVAIVVFVFLLVYRSRAGYEIRVIGENPDAARYAGIDFLRTLLIVMIVSGGAAGLAGAGEVGGIHHHLSYPYTISAGYGFTAIIVAWLARLNPAFVPISAVFFAGITVGGDAIQIALNLPAATVEVFNGLILFFLIVGEFFLRNRVRVVGTRKTAQQPQEVA